MAYCLFIFIGLNFGYGFLLYLAAQIEKQKEQLRRLGKGRN